MGRGSFVVLSRPVWIVFLRGFGKVRDKARGRRGLPGTYLPSCVVTLSHPVVSACLLSVGIELRSENQKGQFLFSRCSSER